MINTIIQGRMLVFVQQVNVLLYYVRKLPFVGEKIPSKSSNGLLVFNFLFFAGKFFGVKFDGRGKKGLCVAACDADSGGTVLSLQDGTKRSERYHLLFSTAIVVWI